MFGLFNTGLGEKIESRKCSICNKFEAIKMDISKELCIFCVRKYLIDSRAFPGEEIKQENISQPERSKREKTIDVHDKDCIKIVNICLHSKENRDNCLYRENCEFINPIVMRCSEHCRNTVSEAK